MRPRDSMRKHSISTIYVLVLIICLRAGSANGAAPSTIRVGYPQLNGGQIPLWNIPEQRLDRQYGLDIKPVYIPGGVRLTQSALSGSVDIALTGGAAINAMLSGAEMIYVGMPVPTYAFSLYARPEIKDVTDLRGKTLGDHQRCIVRSCFHRSPPTVQNDAARFESALLLAARRCSGRASSRSCSSRGSFATYDINGAPAWV